MFKSLKKRKKKVPCWTLNAPKGGFGSWLVQWSKFLDPIFFMIVAS